MGDKFSGIGSPPLGLHQWTTQDSMNFLQSSFLSKAQPVPTNHAPRGWAWASIDQMASSVMDDELVDQLSQSDSTKRSMYASAIQEQLKRAAGPTPSVPLIMGALLICAGAGARSACRMVEGLSIDHAARLRKLSDRVQSLLGQLLNWTSPSCTMVTLTKDMMVSCSARYLARYCSLHAATSRPARAGTSEQTLLVSDIYLTYVYVTS